MALSIKVTARPNLEIPMFSSDQMHRFAEASIEQMKARLADGLDVHDEAAKPLTQAYARQKQAEGHAPIRDLHRSGQMLEALQVLNASQNESHVGIEGEDAYRKALFNEDIDPWFGVSDANNRTLMEEEIEPAFERNLLESNLL
jgi:hypothetical protein